MAVKAIIFDLDNTLIDFNRMKEEACKSAVRAMIGKGLRMKFREAYGKLMDVYWRTGIESNIAFEEFLRKFNGRADERMLAAAINAYLRTKGKFLTPYPGVKPTLRKLKKMGVRLAIVTDAPLLKAYQRLEAMRIDGYFEFVIGKETTGKPKASLVPLKLALKKFGMEPDEVILVGDSLKRDLVPAKELGMRTVLAKYGQTEKESGRADYIIGKIDGMVRLLD